MTFNVTIGRAFTNGTWDSEMITLEDDCYPFAVEAAQIIATRGMENVIHSWVIDVEVINGEHL